MGTGLTGVEVGVRDLDRSARFYRDLLGWREVAGPAAGGSVRRFAGDGVVLDLVEVGAAGDSGGWVNDDLQRGIRHLGMKVADVDAEIRRLQAAGVTVLSPPRDVLGDVRIAFFVDPDGARWEFIQGQLAYQRVHSPELVAAETAATRAIGAGPRFDHVAITVADLDAALRFWCDGFGYEVIGQIRHPGEQGFLMTYLRAGAAVVELFSFDVPTTPHPARPSLGFRSIGVAAPATVRDTAGVAVKVAS